jgi:4'-phosphopantetheinyl transferase
MKHPPAAPAALPPAGVVDVWVLDLAAPELPHDVLVEALNVEERRHAERMRVGGREWAAAHGAMRTILAGYLAVPPGSLQFVRTSAGKPRLDGVAGLEFSFAHTDGLALVAVARDRELGVDVERENDRTDVAAVATEFLPEVEVANVAQAPSPQRRSAFFAAWARHEARLKLRGQALGEPLGSDAAPDAVVVVRPLATRPGFAAAVAAEGEGWRVRMREFHPSRIPTRS